MRRLPIVVYALAAAVLTFPPVSLSAQRYSDEPDGEETCRAVWREFGRKMNGRRVRAVYCEVREVGALPRANSISVDGGAYSGVRVLGGQRSDARVRLVIQTQARTLDDARDLAKRIGLDLASSPLRVTGMLRNRDRDDDYERTFATIAIDAPTRTDLNLDVTYAEIEVENVTGRMELHAQYGPVTLRDVGGDVRARVDYGPISVDLTETKWQGAGLDAESAYGPVTIRVPREFGAELEIGASHGPLNVDFPITLRRFDASRIQTTLGAGGPRVRAVARYGPMSLQMRR
jgi:hypothetical protein